MLKRPQIACLVLLSGAMLTGSAPELLAATSAKLDILPSEQDGPVSSRVDISGVKPLATVNRNEAKPPPIGNPLWSIPLSVLTTTRDRPIFSASRRPPQPAVVAPHLDPVEPPAPQKTVEPPPLALIGAVVGESDAIAVFLNRTDQKIIRLRQGESHAGWVLSSVQPREVTLNMADRTEVLTLQRSGTAAGVPTVANTPPLAVPTGGDVSYAPFVPRSTPKNGESDGL